MKLIYLSSNIFIFIYFLSLQDISCQISVKLLYSIGDEYYGKADAVENRTGYVKSIKIDSTLGEVKSSTVTYTPLFHNSDFNESWIVTNDEFIFIENSYFPNLRSGAKFKKFEMSNMDSLEYVNYRKRLQDSITRNLGSTKAAVALQGLEDMKKSYKNIFVPFQNYKRDFIRNSNLKELESVRYDVILSVDRSEYYSLINYKNSLQKWSIDFNNPTNSKLLWEKNITETSPGMQIDSNSIIVDSSFFKGDLIYFDTPDSGEFMLSTFDGAIYDLVNCKCKVGNMDVNEKVGFIIKDVKSGNVYLNMNTSLDDKLKINAIDRSLLEILLTCF